MSRAGYRINSKVSIVVDPDLSIMGYATKDGNLQKIVVAGWSLDSPMLGGLVLHELSHVYHAERGRSSHKHGLVEAVLSSIAKSDGLSMRERRYLVECSNHLQNIIVGDLVFRVLSDKELEMARRFFPEWVTERATGDPVLDAAILCRNAFAVASLTRRNLYDRNGDMDKRNREFISALGKNAEDGFRDLESILRNAKGNLSASEFRRLVASYVGRVLSLMRDKEGLEDLR
jgi:hypothetical protein